MSATRFSNKTATEKDRRVLEPGHKSTLRSRFDAYRPRGRRGDCWLWTGSINARGYGQISDHGWVYTAHRLAFIYARGLIPRGLMVCHRCNTRRCCNPAHLYAGTSRDNNRDAVRAGTAVVPIGPRGETHHDAKLTRDIVREIRRSPLTGVALAAKYGVTKSNISRIRKGKTWKSV